MQAQATDEEAGWGFLSEGRKERRLQRCGWQVRMVHGRGVSLASKETLNSARQPFKKIK